MLARQTGCDVVTFEFDEACVSRVRRNLALNPRLARHVTLVETYVAHEHSSFPRADTLDDLVDSGRLFMPDFIKLDVEGAEANVLAGAQRILAERRPHVFIETHSQALEEQCIEMLRASRYVPTVVDQRRWLPENRRTEHNRWLAAPGASRIH